MGKHDMGSLTARWRLYFNMSVVSFCLAPSLNETTTRFQQQEMFGAKRCAVSFILTSCCEQILDKHRVWRCFKISSLFVLRVRHLSESKKAFYMNNSP